MPLDDVLVMGKARSPSSSRARAGSSRRGDVALPRLHVVTWHFRARRCSRCSS